MPVAQALLSVNNTKHQATGLIYLFIRSEPRRFFRTSANTVRILQAVVLMAQYFELIGIPTHLSYQLPYQKTEDQLNGHAHHVGSGVVSQFLRGAIKAYLAV